MVKVGNSECEFLKLTPLSRSSAIAGAVCGVTMRPRRPSGTNRIRLRGVAFCADAEPAASAIRPADSNMIVRRIRFSPNERTSGDPPLSSFSFALRQDCYIGWNPPQGRSAAAGGQNPIFRATQGKHRAWIVRAVAMSRALSATNADKERAQRVSRLDRGGDRPGKIAEHRLTSDAFIARGREFADTQTTGRCRYFCPARHRRKSL